MMEQYFRQFNEATGKTSRFVIGDLFDDQNMAAGTLVEIMIK